MVFVSDFSHDDDEPVVVTDISTKQTERCF